MLLDKTHAFLSKLVNKYSDKDQQTAFENELLYHRDPPPPLIQPRLPIRITPSASTQKIGSLKKCSVEADGVLSIPQLRQLRGHYTGTVRPTSTHAWNPFGRLLVAFASRSPGPHLCFHEWCWQCGLGFVTARLEYTDRELTNCY